MKNTPKNKQNLLQFGGKFKTWGGVGRIFSPKGPEKTHCLVEFKVYSPGCLPDALLVVLDITDNTTALCSVFVVDN